jgi:hypothetical protein
MINQQNKQGIQPIYGTVTGANCRRDSESDAVARRRPVRLGACEASCGRPPRTSAADAHPKMARRLPVSRRSPTRREWYDAWLDWCSAFWRGRTKQASHAHSGPTGRVTQQGRRSKHGEPQDRAAATAAAQAALYVRARCLA